MSSAPLPPPPPYSAVKAGAPGSWPLGVATAIKVISIIAAVVWGLFGVAVLNRVMILRDLQNETFGDDIVERADNADSYAAAAAGLGLALSLALAILLMIWLYRTTKLLRIRGYSTRYKPGWAIGGAFIPIAQFVIIFQMLSDCRQALSQFNGAAVKDRYLCLPWWWGLQTAVIIVGRALSSSESEEIDSLLNLEYVRLGMAVTLVGAVVLAAITFDHFRTDFS